MKNTRMMIALLALSTLAACSSTPTSSPLAPQSSESDVGSLAPQSSSSTSPSSSMMSASSKTTDTWDGTYLKGKHTVTLKTSMGDITLELNADASPKTVTNFVTLSKQGYYEGLTFHRVIPGFMIQGGDPNGNGTGGKSIYGARFDDEIDSAPDLYTVGYKQGVVAMANAGPNTNGSQFFIMDSDYPLPPNYTIFGKVTAGQDVVSKIANVARGPNDRPLTPVTFSVIVK